jgi:heme exporter protein B
LKIVYLLIQKELMLELRRRSVIAGISLYVFSLVFICYLTFSLRQNSISPATWSALFWLCILFSVINSVAKSFIGERKGLFIYYYTIASAQAIILSKIIYNTVLAFVLSAAAVILFSIFIGNPVQDTGYFWLVLFLASWGFSAALSLISGIASKSNNSNILMAVLSFPVVIAILLMAIRITKNVVDGIERSASTDELLNLLAINLILTSLAYLLFRYIWRS